MRKHISYLGAALFGMICALNGVMFTTLRGASIFASAIIWVYLARVEDRSVTRGQ